MHVKGINGQLTLTPSEVIISRQGALGFLSQGFKGDKSIDISQVTSVQFKNAGMWFNGYLQLAFVGGRETQGGLFDATSDENTVMFKHSQQNEFEAMRDAIKQRSHEFRSAPAQVSAAGSTADELEKLAGLRDRGIISGAEFDVQKRKVLGF